MDIIHLNYYIWAFVQVSVLNVFYISRFQAFFPQQCVFLWFFQEQTHCAVRHAAWRLLAPQQGRVAAWATWDQRGIWRVESKAQGPVRVNFIQIPHQGFFFFFLLLAFNDVALKPEEAVKCALCDQQT